MPVVNAQGERGRLLIAPRTEWEGKRGSAPVMSFKELRQLANKKRDEAARARRLAKMLSALSDRERLLQHAEELEIEARELEHDASQPPQGPPARGRLSPPVA